ncbi:carboxymuconolactone decarboxylase family protein [Dactylosporangium sp. NPDC051541]|uniref:carboxymuconolactone decarboxylase family protein n=1 Tax=Dactylosporangium sp. NPDC051541 TaxID=3363977 RepID=UPI0037B47F45
MSTEALTSRLPDPLELFPEMPAIAAGLSKLVDNGAVPKETIGLVHLRAGQIVGSTYHTVRQAALLRAAGETAERLDSLPSWRDSPYFTAAERAALALVEAVLAPDPAGERVSDALFAEAAAHFDDKALWTLTVAIGQFMFFVPVAAIAKPIPGRPVGQNYSK